MSQVHGHRTERNWHLLGVLLQPPVGLVQPGEIRISTSYRSTSRTTLGPLLQQAPMRVFRNSHQTESGSHTAPTRRDVSNCTCNRIPAPESVSPLPATAMPRNPRGQKTPANCSIPPVNPPHPSVS